MFRTRLKREKGPADVLNLKIPFPFVFGHVAEISADARSSVVWHFIENGSLRNILSCHIQKSSDCTSLILSTESRFAGISSVTKLETVCKKTPHIFINSNLVLSEYVRLLCIMKIPEKNSLVSLTFADAVKNIVCFYVNANVYLDFRKPSQYHFVLCSNKELELATLSSV